MFTFSRVDLSISAKNRGSENAIACDFYILIEERDQK